MTDTYVDPDYSPSLAKLDTDQLVADAVPDYGVDTTKMREGLAKVSREKAEAVKGASERQLEAAKKGHEFVSDKYAGIGPLDVQEWDGDKEREERIQSPLEAFGSAAGIFAMIASAFTRTPMNNALNAGAAAINSVRANDYHNYDLAYKEWKTNTDLAIKRHETEREAFKDAMELYKSDPIAGGAEMKAVAARFGAEAELAMIDAGYVDQVFQIQKAKSEAARSIIAQSPNLAKMDEVVRTQMLAQQAISEAEKNLQRPLTATEQAQVIGEIRRSMSPTRQRPLSPEAVAIEKFREETIATTGVEPTSEQLAEFRQTWKGKQSNLGTYKGTEAQNKAILYGSSLDRGMANIEKMLKSGYVPTVKDMALFELMESERREKGVIPSVAAIAANYGLSPQAQQFYQAAREFTAGVLRQETGAAFRPGEITNTISRFVDAPGESPEVKEQKAAARRQQRDAVWVTSGLPRDAWTLQNASSVLSGGKPSIGAQQDAPPINLLSEGKTTKFKNGESWTLRDGKPVRVDQ